MCIYVIQWFHLQDPISLFYQIQETDEARKKFTNAKSISSAQFFGDQSKSADVEAHASLQKFSVCTTIVNYYIHIWVNNLFWFINILSKYILFNWIIMMPLHILRYLYLYLPNFLDLWNDSQNHSCGLEKWILKPTGKIPLYLTRWAEILRGNSIAVDITCNFVLTSRVLLPSPVLTFSVIEKISLLILLQVTLSTVYLFR